MDSIVNYLRIGVEYYKINNIPMSIDSIMVLQRWNKQTIIDDFGKKQIKEIPKYNGFCMIPSHNNFKKEINGFYNKYNPLDYDLKDGSWQDIEMFLRHIFEEHFDLAIDYLSILWHYPNQKLPILCLVSKERNTGKTTFLNLLKLLFQNNVTINTNEDFRSRFNSDWAGKLIIAVDEVLLDRREDSERIKNLATSLNYKSESKGKDKEEVEFIGKFVMCSNNEDSFIKMDSLEIRYWVRKVKPLEKANPNLLEKLKEEIPAFASHLQNRTIVTKKLTRMWFTPQQIETEALQRLVKGNKTTIEKELVEFVSEQLELFELDEICFPATHLVKVLNERGVKCSTTYLGSILFNNYNMESKNSSYKLYRSEFMSNGEQSICNFTREKGRAFTFKRDDFIKE